MNTQPIEKRIPKSSLLDIHSIFLTIQGEGPYCGQRAVFVRLAGCNLRCPGCDTEYTEGRKSYLNISIYDKISELSKGEPILVVITGGEPFRQDFSELANALIVEGYTVQVETNGTLPPPDNLHKNVMIVCSPKTGSVNPKLLKRVNCFKYVMHNQFVGDDGLPEIALGHHAHPRLYRPPADDKRPIYLQPMDSQHDFINQMNLNAVIKSCMKYGYILQLQIHKIICME